MRLISHFGNRSPKGKLDASNDPVPEPTVELRLGDCLTEMSKIRDHTIDLILTDLPYGVQRLPWDNPIDLTPLWQHYLRVVKPNRPILLFGKNPFAAKL